MKIEVPYAREGDASPTSQETNSKATPEANSMTTQKSSPDTSPSTSPSTIASSTPPRTCPARTETEPATSPKQPTNSKPTVDPSTDSDSDSDPDSEHGLLPFEVQFARFMKLGYPDEVYYSTRYSVRLSSGYWLANEIPLDQVVRNIPIIGFVNEYNQPIPSLDGPDIHLTLASIDTITHIGEENDQTAMLDLGQVFYLNGPRKGQLNDAYAWIALRGNEGDKFVMSRRARNRLVPNWKDLIKDWQNFDECIPDPCHELQKLAVRGSGQTIHCVRVICAQRGIDLIEANLKQILTGEIDESHPAAKLLAAGHEILVTARSFQGAIENMQAIVDNMEV